MNETELTRTFIALLTTRLNGDDLAGSQILITLNPKELMFIVGMSLGMLAHEIRLGCTDAMIPVDEYLSMLGLAAASDS